ncbi:8877_t:CDS:2, partial [Funneliformis geosporum]
RRDSLVSRWISLFVPENVLRFTGKFTLNELPPHDPLEVIVNADTMFKSIKIFVNEFTKDTSSGKKFQIKCRYLKSDERINKKLIKARRSSNLLITGKLIQVDSEFQVDIQGINFLPMSIANLESSTKTSLSSKYLWSTITQISGKVSAQAMANIFLNQTSQKSSKTPSKDQTDKESVITNDQ